MDFAKEKPCVVMILHAYQPPYPVQEKWVVSKIVENSYYPIAKGLEDHPNVRFILNMNASLTEILMKEAPQVLELFKEAANRGQIEFLESGAYHPIFPFLTEEEKKEQLRLNHKINRRVFGKEYNPIGVWPPELAIDEKSLSVFAEMGYKYSVVPNNSLPAGVDQSIPYLNATEKFALITRDRLLSNNIAFKSFGNQINDLVKAVANLAKSKPLVLAMDLETFGEHHKDYYYFLFRFLGHQDLCSGTSSDLFQTPSWIEVKRVLPSSWSTEDHERDRGIPYPLWDHPANAVHAIQHMHFRLLQETMWKAGGLEKLKHDEETKQLYLKAMHSCQWWWASGNGRWSPSMIRKGFELQREALKKLCRKDSFEQKLSDILLHRLEFSIGR